MGKFHKSSGKKGVLAWAQEVSPGGLLSAGVLNDAKKNWLSMVFIVMAYKKNQFVGLY